MRHDPFELEAKKTALCKDDIITSLNSDCVYAQTKYGDFWYKVLMKTKSGWLLFDSCSCRWIRAKEISSVTSQDGVEKVSFDQVMNNWKNVDFFDSRKLEQDLIRRFFDK